MNTSQAEVIKKCRKDLQKERIIKSVLSGMAVGFAVIFVVAFITCFVEFKGLWLSIGLGFAAWAVAALVFYFAVFKLTDLAVMQRLDRAGLDERMVTMYELQGDNSYMAQRQRADASAAFSAAVKMSGGRLIKTQIATAIICATSIICPFGAGMAALTALRDYSVLPPLGEWGGGGGLGHGGAQFYTVTYEVGGVEDGGWFEDGVTSVKQTIEHGGTAAVKIQPAADNEGYIYYLEKVVDGDGNVYYTSSNEFVYPDVRKSMVFTAMFEKEYAGEEGMINYYYDPNQKDSNKDNGDRSESNEQNEQSEPEPGDNDPGMSGPPSPGSATDDNTIIDGQTQYDEEYDYYYGLAMDMLANGTDGYPPELVSMLEGYFGILLK